MYIYRNNVQEMYKSTFSHKENFRNRENNTYLLFILKDTVLTKKRENPYKCEELNVN